jgi:OmpA-OmpF porin, OOP family
MKATTAALAFAALMGTGFAQPAAAQYRLNEEPGLYAGGSLGWNNDDELTWRILGGYQINRNFAAELGYHDLGQHNIRGAPLDSTAWELVGIGRVPFGERFAAFGKLGAYRSNSRGGGFDQSQNDLTFGAGVEYALSRNVSARGEWQRYRDIGGGAIGGVADLDVYSVGALYRFR